MLPPDPMSYEPRTIAYLSELLYPPIQLRTDVVQGIHNALFQQPEVAYQNFQVAQDGIHLTNTAQSPGAVSSVTFLPDRLVLREELRSTTVEEYATRLVNVATVAFQALGVQSSIAQQFVVRTLVTPPGDEGATAYLARHVLSANESGWSRIGRPVQGLGFRVMLPPHEDHKEAFHLRFESWHADPRSVWIENVGSFTQPTAVENLPELSSYLYATYKFLTGRAIPFLASFAQKP
jgi:hypothetical protein